MVLFLFIVWCIIIILVVKFYMWLAYERECEEIKKTIYERTITELRSQVSGSMNHSESMEVNSSEKYEGRIKVKYRGVEYWAYKRDDYSDMIRLVDFTSGWTNYGKLPEWTQGKRCWNVLIDEVKIIHKIYLGGE